MLSDFQRIFFSEPHRITEKWLNYLEVYERHMARFRGRRLRLVEFGVSQGGSLDLWERYFGADAELIGVDINPDCRRFERANVRVHVCDQGDRVAMTQLARAIGPVDIVLDDGGHTMTQQINTFDIFYPLVRDRGVFICEDVHTSYQPQFGGGLRHKGSFIEYMKAKVDELNAWHAAGGAEVTDFTRTAQAICFYASIVVVEKQRFDGPVYVEAGY
jgi:hypothetical protein